MIEKFEKIICVVILVMLVVTILWCISLTQENKALRAALDAPVNCEAVCEQVFEHLGC